MKATGIVRRVDDLGRVVIPKEIRQIMHIKEGYPMEIFTDRDGSIIFKKYDVTYDLKSAADTLEDKINSCMEDLDTETAYALQGHIREIQKCIKSSENNGI